MSSAHQMLLAIPGADVVPGVADAIIQGASAAAWVSAALKAANANSAGSSAVIFATPTLTPQVDFVGAGSSAVDFQTPSGSPPVFLQDGSYLGTGACGFGVGNNGDVTATNDGGYTWLLTGAASDYEVRATLFVGDTPSGTLGVWIGCGVNRAWSLLSAPKLCGLTIEIRDVATHTVQATCSVGLEADT